MQTPTEDSRLNNLWWQHSYHAMARARTIFHHGNNAHVQRGGLQALELEVFAIRFSGQQLAMENTKYQKFDVFDAMSICRCIVCCGVYDGVRRGTRYRSCFGMLLLYWGLSV